LRHPRFVPFSVTRFACVTGFVWWEYQAIIGNKGDHRFQIVGANSFAEIVGRLPNGGGIVIADRRHLVPPSTDMSKQFGCVVCSGVRANG